MAKQLPRDEFERRLRAMWDEPMPPGFEPSEISEATARAKEVQIAFAMWVYDEQERGTGQSVLLRSAGHVIGSTIQNLIQPWEPHPEQYVAAQVIVLDAINEMRLGGMQAATASMVNDA